MPTALENSLAECRNLPFVDDPNVCYLPNPLPPVHSPDDHVISINLAGA